MFVHASKSIANVLLVQGAAQKSNVFLNTLAPEQMTVRKFFLHEKMQNFINFYLA